MKRSPLRKRSKKGKLRKRIGELHFKLLLLQRGARCELCGGKANLGRFHIMRVGKYPKLEFYDRNVLIAGWFCCHYPHHHFGADDPVAIQVIDKIKVLRGENYRKELIAADIIQPKLTETQLNFLLVAFKQEYERIK